MHPDRDQFGNAGLLHGHSVEGVSHLHGPLAVGDEQKLGLPAHGLDLLGVASQVDVVQRSIHFVQDAKWLGW